jgi:hypothetical protein
MTQPSKSRGDVVLDALTTEWAPASTIRQRVWSAGYRWSDKTLRLVLAALVESRDVQVASRRGAGSWRPGGGRPVKMWRRDPTRE